MQPILLLHGAIGAKDQLEPLKEILKAHYKVYTLSFSGHGGAAVKDAFSIKQFAADALAYMEQEGLQKLSIFGYSMGGYVGMYLAKYHPEKVDKLVTLATKYHWDVETAAKEVQMLNAEKIAAKVPAFAQALEERHAPNNWKDVLKHTGDMLAAMGNDNPLKPADYITIETPVLVMLGDKDKMVTLDETVAVYRSLPNAQMAVLPATQHPIEQVDPQLAAYFIRRFVG